MERSTTGIVLAAALIVTLAGAFNDVSGQAGRRTDVLDVNTASDTELRTVPNVSPAVAQSIAGRRPFLTMAELDMFLGQSLSREQRTETFRKLFLQINLNTATDAEIMLIPGLGNRMLREFKEYRPYTAMPQFRREIGKYVNEQELARLEQYVFVPINLNTASDADILTIPGLGNRMLGEFKEYRPYQNIAQFRREIGKYVNERELARLERYVTLN